MKKKTKSTRQSAAEGSSAKASSGSGDVDKYLAKVPQPARSTLQKIRTMVRSAAPREATEAISYGIPAFKYNGMLVAYAAFADHCSFFPASGDLLKEFAEDLKDYPCSKGTIRFAVDKPLPAALIKKMVKARVAKNQAKVKAKKAR
jgi:uncharacterized protein YdhG (YjbR/CyaY superfamily)